jgi:dihydroorotate dehydrogenase (NAD+) catalytic subunit
VGLIVAKVDWLLTQPLLNAAGMLGFAPEKQGGLPPLDWARLGAFVTNPISLQPRAPAAQRGILAYPGGFLLHSGYPNPGLKAVLRQYAAAWAAAPLPIVAHLLARQPHEVDAMVRRLEGVAGVAGIELGLPPEVDAAGTRLLVQAALGELPLIVRLPLDRVWELAAAVREAAFGAPLAGISFGPPRGALATPSGAFVTGRLYGPGLFPQTLAITGGLASLGVPLIAAGGVYQREQWEALLAVGASAVQLDTVLWRGDFAPSE